jgi:hypothetical protein
MAMFRDASLFLPACRGTGAAVAGGCLFPKGLSAVCPAPEGGDEARAGMVVREAADVKADEIADNRADTHAGK